MGKRDFTYAASSIFSEPQQLKDDPIIGTTFWDQVLKKLRILCPNGVFSFEEYYYIRFGSIKYKL